MAYNVVPITYGKTPAESTIDFSSDKMLDVFKSFKRCPNAALPMYVKEHMLYMTLRLKMIRQFVGERLHMTSIARLRRQELKTVSLLFPYP